MHSGSNHDQWKNQDLLALGASLNGRSSTGNIALPRRRQDAARDQAGGYGSKQDRQNSVSQTSVLPSISQDELKQYQALSIEEKEIRGRREQLKDALIRKFQQGARVERGRLKASLREQRSRCLTGKNLLPILGSDQVKFLKNQVEPTISFTIKIE